MNEGAREMGIALITGANRGIGLGMAETLKNRGFEVIAAVRRRSEALDALGVRVEEGLELADPASVAAFGERMAGEKLDLLVQNAGVARMTPLETPNAEAMNAQWQVNALAPLLLTQALLPCLGEGGKVALVTSRMGSIADNGSGGHYGYRMSKAALNMLGKCLSIDLAPKGIAVCILHPGMVATDMLNGFVGGSGQFPPGTTQPAEIAEQLMDRVEGLTPDNSGSFWHANGELLPW